MSNEYTQPTKNIFFPEQKEPFYDPTDPILTQEFAAYWKREKDRCRDGFTLADGQVKIPGFLYWHCVYWKIAMYVERNKRKIRIIDTPYLRDIDWDVIGDLEKCSDEGHFYCLVGSRDWGKSIIAASRAGWQYTLFDNSESVISAGAENYIKLATDKIEDGLTNIHPIFKKNRISNDWKKEVRAGWKDKKTNQPDPKSSNARIIIRNYQDGNNTMAANGTRPGFHLIDEIGTLPNLIGCIKDSDGCWWSGDGDKPSCLPMFTGCVCAGTKVWTEEGRSINIEDLKQEDGIIGYDGYNSVSHSIRWLKPPTKKPCYKITTTGNNIIECSEDHPFISSSRKTRTMSGKVKNILRASYKEAKTLSIGDYLLTIDEIPIFGPNKIEHAYLYGLMLGDGYFKGSSLSVDDKAVREYVTSNYATSTRKEFITKCGTLYTDLYIKKPKSIFGHSGLQGLTKENKRLPEDIYNYDKESLSLIIAGLFDSDGNVCYNEKRGTRVVLTNISEKLLNDTKQQLLKFGIHSSIYKENRNTTPQDEYKGQKDHIYRLYISRDLDVERFIDNIPIRHSKKLSSLKQFKKGNRDFRSAGILFTHIGECEDEKFITNRKLLQGYKFETITKIEYIGEQNVYNLNTTGSHNYIANQFITGNTGGDMEVGAEAAEIFFAPEAYNILSFDNPEGPGKMGRFVSALRARMAYKEPKTLASYLGIAHQDLEKITILVSNEERAYNEWWKPQFDKNKKSGNPKTVIKFKAYWPVKPSDSFIIVSTNNYNIEAAKAQRTKLLAMEYTGTPVFLKHDGEHIKHVFTDKLPISEFPCKTQDTDAPAVIWEFPVENPPWGLYIAGVDPYRQDESEYSDSLGAIYIFKRMHDISSERYQDMFVASYVARPKTVDEWNEQARLLIKYYNAYTLVENDDMTFIRYMQNKGDDFYLCDQPAWLQDIVPMTTVNRSKGIHRSSEKIRNFLRGCLKRYLDDVVLKEVDDKGSVTREVLGVSKVMDSMLLDEIIKFNAKEGNYDREVAASLALALADKMTPLGKVNSNMTDPRYQSLFKTNTSSSPMETSKLFKLTRSSIFPARRIKLFH